LQYQYYFSLKFTLIDGVLAGISDSAGEVDCKASRTKSLGLPGADLGIPTGVRGACFELFAGIDSLPFAPVGVLALNLSMKIFAGIGFFDDGDLGRMRLVGDSKVDVNNKLD
jgi:hypothetical protein